MTLVMTELENPSGMSIFLHDNKDVGPNYWRGSDLRSILILAWAFIYFYSQSMPLFMIREYRMLHHGAERPRFTYVFWSRQAFTTGVLAPPADTPGIRPTKLT